MDFHNDEVYYARAVQKLKEDQDVARGDKKAIMDFVDDCLAGGISYSRARKYVSHLHLIKQFNGGGFSLVGATEKDLKKTLAKLEKSDYSPRTKSSYKQAVKKFYTDHLKKKDMVEWIKTGVKKSERYLPDDLLTEEEVEALYAAPSSTRDKAVMAFLEEGGFRPKELGTLLFQDVEEVEKGMAVRVREGKTGQRRVLIVRRQKEVRDWMAQHPFKKRDTPLFPTVDKYSKQFVERALGYKGICHVLGKMKKLAGLSKPLNPYLLRHTRATKLANFMTEAQMTQYLGWVPGSQMPGVYVHLSGRDTDNALLQHYKIVKDDRGGLIVCPRCGETNKSEAAYCARCGLPFDVKALYKEDLDERVEKLEMALELITDAMKWEKENPRVKNKKE